MSPRSAPGLRASTVPSRPAVVPPAGPPPAESPPAESPPAESPPAALHQRFAAVLVDLTFPARRWQVITEAEWYGCDAVTRSMLDRLPDRAYSSLPDLVGVLAAAPTRRPGAAYPPAGARVVPRLREPQRTARPPRDAAVATPASRAAAARVRRAGSAA